MMGWDIINAWSLGPWWLSALSWKLNETKFKWNKARCVTWEEFSESESEEDSENEEAMLCFIAIEENEQEENENEIEEKNPSYDDFLCAFEELHDKKKKRTLKRNNISSMFEKWKCVTPKNANKELNDETDKLKMSIEKKISFHYYEITWARKWKLNKQIKGLRKIFEKFTEGTRYSTYMLEQQEVFLINKDWVITWKFSL